VKYTVCILCIHLTPVIDAVRESWSERSYLFSHKVWQLYLTDCLLRASDFRSLRLFFVTDVSKLGNAGQICGLEKEGCLRRLMSFIVPTLELNANATCCVGVGLSSFLCNLSRQRPFYRTISLSRNSIKCLQVRQKLGKPKDLPCAMGTNKTRWSIILLHDRSDVSLLKLTGNFTYRKF
jgi:hypothetical protein